MQGKENRGKEERKKKENRFKFNKLFLYINLNSFNIFFLF